MSILRNANILVTGGAGTLGRAIARARKNEGWTGKLTVYSTDNHKHDLMRRLFPDVTCIQGDIRNFDTLRAAMTGHDVVIHAAAVKVIPDSESWSIDTIDVNINGSLAVCQAAAQVGVPHLLGISTDKACHAANAYGATKLLMEKIFQELAPTYRDTQFHLVRYGNVLESTGSVIEAWKKTIEAGGAPRMTDPDMTRFWLSPAQAVQYVKNAMEFPSGFIYIPKMPSLEIGKLYEFTVGYTGSNTISERPVEKIPLRPGEKMHETLLTVEEGWHAAELTFRGVPSFWLEPSVCDRKQEPIPAYSSDIARRLTQVELLELLRND